MPRHGRLSAAFHLWVHAATGGMLGLFSRYHHVGTPREEWWYELHAEAPGPWFTTVTEWPEPVPFVWADQVLASRWEHRHR